MFFETSEKSEANFHEANPKTIEFIFKGVKTLTKWLFKPFLISQDFFYTETDDRVKVAEVNCKLSNPDKFQ